MPVNMLLLYLRVHNKVLGTHSHPTDRAILNGACLFGSRAKSGHPEHGSKRPPETNPSFLSAAHNSGLSTGRRPPQADTQISTSVPLWTLRVYNLLCNKTGPSISRALWGLPRATAGNLIASFCRGITPFGDQQLVAERAAGRNFHFVLQVRATRLDKQRDADNVS